MPKNKRQGVGMKFKNPFEDFLNWILIGMILLLIIISAYDGNEKIDMNYGDPIQFPQKAGEVIEIELALKSWPESRYRIRSEDIFFFRLQGQSFECRCAHYWCRGGVRKHQKIIRFRKAAIRFAEGTIRRTITKGTRFCQIDSWEFWDAADEAKFRAWADESPPRRG